MKDTVIDVLKHHFGDKPIEENTHLMDDLGGDEFDIVDVIGFKECLCCCDYLLNLRVKLL